MPYYDPKEGWKVGDQRIDDEDAVADLCQKAGIPFIPSKEAGVRRQMFFMDTYVAGMQFVPDIDYIIPEMAKGDQIQLVRDPFNEYDRMAVQVVLAKDQEMIGFIPRTCNAPVASLMDQGVEFTASVKSIGQNVVEISIFMKNPEGFAAYRHFIWHSDMNVWVVRVPSRPASRDPKFQDIIGPTRKYLLEREFSESELWHIRWGFDPIFYVEKWKAFVEGDCMYICFNHIGECVFKLDVNEG